MFNGHSTVSAQQILDKISEEELFRYYCTGFKKLDESFKSDLRREDIPSCRVSDFGGFLLYKDFGSSERGTNVWGYLKRKYGITYMEAIDIVVKDFNLTARAVVPEFTINFYDSFEKKQRRTIIRIKSRKWLLIDKEYWYEKYGITKELLNVYKVLPVTYIWINDRPIKTEKLAYCYNYYYHQERLLRKIYQPLSSWKWYSNIDNTVVQGIANIPKYSDLLIITKSLKDVMCLNLLGYNSVAPNNEMSWLPELVWHKFITRYKRMIILFDNDESGIVNAQKFSNKYGVHYYHLPEESGVKDISDYINKYRNLDKAKQLIKNLIL